MSVHNQSYEMAKLVKKVEPALDVFQELHEVFLSDAEATSKIPTSVVKFSLGTMSLALFSLSNSGRSESGLTVPHLMAYSSIRGRVGSSRTVAGPTPVYYPEEAAATLQEIPVSAGERSFFWKQLVFKATRTMDRSHYRSNASFETALATSDKIIGRLGGGVSRSTWAERSDVINKQAQAGNHYKGHFETDPLYLDVETGKMLFVRKVLNLDSGRTEDHVLPRHYNGYLEADNSLVYQPNIPYECDEEKDVILVQPHILENDINGQESKTINDFVDKVVAGELSYGVFKNSNRQERDPWYIRIKDETTNKLYVICEADWDNLPGDSQPLVRCFFEIVERRTSREGMEVYVCKIAEPEPEAAAPYFKSSELSKQIEQSVKNEDNIVAIPGVNPEAGVLYEAKQK